MEWIDAEGRIIEVVSRARMRTENLRHRSVAIIVRATDGRLLVHRRADTKDLLPGWWDLCVGGVVGVGESDDDAARRELAEEVGVDDVDLVGVGRASWDDDQVREWCRIYRVTHDGPFTFADGEVAEARFVPPHGLRTLLAGGRVLPGSVAMIVPLLGW